MGAGRTGVAAALCSVATGCVAPMLVSSTETTRTIQEESLTFAPTGGPAGTPVGEDGIALELAASGSFGWDGEQTRAEGAPGQAIGALSGSAGLRLGVWRHLELSPRVELTTAGDARRLATDLELDDALAARAVLGVRYLLPVTESFRLGPVGELGVNSLPLSRHVLWEQVETRVDGETGYAASDSYSSDYVLDGRAWTPHASGGLQARWEASDFSIGAGLLGQTTPLFEGERSWSELCQTWSDGRTECTGEVPAVDDIDAWRNTGLLLITADVAVPIGEGVVLGAQAWALAAGPEELMRAVPAGATGRVGLAF